MKACPLRIVIIALCLIVIILFIARCIVQDFYTNETKPKYVGNIKSYDKINSEIWIVFSTKDVGYRVKLKSRSYGCAIQHPENYFPIGADMYMYSADRKGVKHKFLKMYNRSYKVLRIL